MQLTLDMVSDLIGTITNSTTPAAAYSSLDALIDRLFQRKLFTILRYVPADEEVERLFSSNAGSYEPRGRKKKANTVWGVEVYDKGNVLISQDENDIRVNFPDHETIIGLGIGGMINMPLVWHGRVIGSMNISQDAGAFSQHDIPELKMLAGLIAPIAGHDV